MKQHEQLTATDLAARFGQIYDERMKTLPIVNRQLQVEAVGFCDFENKQLGVLITPWFMNLVIIDRPDTWIEQPQGDTITICFPHGPIEFTVSHDDALGSYLSAVLFRTMSDVPDQETARDLAIEIMAQLFIEPPQQERSFSRRALFTGTGKS